MGDVIEMLTDTDRPRKYWRDLKSKLNKEGSQLSAKIGQLKLQSDDGKSYITDVAVTQYFFSLIYSITQSRAIQTMAGSGRL
jgi:DNA-damage-inducible protein D